MSTVLSAEGTTTSSHTKCGAGKPAPDPPFLGHPNGRPTTSCILLDTLYASVTTAPSTEDAYVWLSRCYEAASCGHAVLMEGPDGYTWRVKRHETGCPFLLLLTPQDGLLHGLTIHAIPAAGRYNATRITPQLQIQFDSDWSRLYGAMGYEEYARLAARTIGFTVTAVYPSRIDVCAVGHGELADLTQGTTTGTSTRGHAQLRVNRQRLPARDVADEAGRRAAVAASDSDRLYAVNNNGAGKDQTVSVYQRSEADAAGRPRFHVEGRAKRKRLKKVGLISFDALTPTAIEDLHRWFTGDYFRFVDGDGAPTASWQQVQEAPLDPQLVRVYEASLALRPLALAAAGDADAVLPVVDEEGRLSYVHAETGEVLAEEAATEKALADEDNRYDEYPPASFSPRRDRPAVAPQLPVNGPMPSTRLSVTPSNGAGLRARRAPLAANQMRPHLADSPCRSNATRAAPSHRRPRGRARASPQEILASSRSPGHRTRPHDTRSERSPPPPTYGTLESALAITEQSFHQGPPIEMLSNA